MNTRLLMTGSAGLMAVAGLAITFAPGEILAAAGSTATAPAVLLMQALGALYLGFAMLNWMARGNLIGGIYSRPVAMANFMHFTVLGLALAKSALAGQDNVAVFLAFVIVSALALAFARVAFTHPPGKTA